MLVSFQPEERDYVMTANPVSYVASCLYCIIINDVVTIGSKHPKAARKEMTIGLLLKELSSEVSADWEDIGLYLELKPHILHRIKGDNQQSCKKCFREMIKAWFQQVDPPPSWSAIIEAIENLEYESLAHELRKKYS